MTRYKTQQNQSVEYIRSDTGGEFHSTVLKIEKHYPGVTDQYVPARCHEPNGFIERVNRTFAEGVRAVLKASHMPLGLWGEAMQHLKHAHNLTPHTALIARRCDVPIPHVLFHNKSAERLVHLHAQLLPFGMSCFVQRVREHPKKLADRSEAGYIVGYGPSSRMYRVLIVNSASSIMRFRIVRHLYVTSDQHREYHCRTEPPFKLYGFPCMRNVGTCADPLSSAIISCVQIYNSVIAEDATIRSCSVYPSPIPPAGVYVQSISTKSSITGSQSALRAGNSHRKRSRDAPIIFQDEKSIQERGHPVPT
jgi:hypothetical protein